MSEPSAREVIAGVLGEHRFYWDGWFLNCPSCPDWRGRCDYDKELHRADAVIAAGVTMPAEPEFDGRCQQPVATRGGRPCVLDIGHDGGCF